VSNKPEYYVKIPVGDSVALGRGIQCDLEGKGYTNVTVQQEVTGRPYYVELEADIKTIAAQRDEFRGKLKAARKVALELLHGGETEFERGLWTQELEYILRSGTGEGGHK
jgi:hypothetical protein